MKNQARSNRKDKPAQEPDNPFEGPRGAAGARAAVIVPVLTGRLRGESAPQLRRTPEARLEEAIGLAAAIDLEIVSSGIVTVATPKPGTLFGSGKVEELAAIVKAEEIELVVVDHPLTPIQQRNLEKALYCKVLDRTGLILEIFGDRASTAEGTLQVELAHLKWQKSRLVRSWTHLERQRGGLGFVGGPGETQIEADRRLIQERINRLEKDLEQVTRTRELHRAKRKKVPQPVVALVGYTNAGKSTLFNRLTAADVYAADQLFATLDTTLRRGRLPCGRDVVYADTVGFIRHLPHELVTAFRSTLEEARDAGLLLHVIDAAGPERERCIADVEAVLTDIGALSVPRLDVYNKIDLLADCPARVDRDAEGRPVRVWVSARTGAGIALLIDAIRERVEPSMQEGHLRLSASEGRLRAKLFAEGAVVAEELDEEGGWRLHLRLPRVRLEQLASSEPGLKERLKD